MPLFHSRNVCIGQRKGRHFFVLAAQKQFYSQTQVLQRKKNVLYFHPFHWVISILWLKQLNFHCAAKTEDEMCKIGRSLTRSGVMKRKEIKKKLYRLLLHRWVVGRKGNSSRYKFLYIYVRQRQLYSNIGVTVQKVRSTRHGNKEWNSYAVVKRDDKQDHKGWWAWEEGLQGRDQAVGEQWTYRRCELKKTCVKTV